MLDKDTSFFYLPLNENLFYTLQDTWKLPLPPALDLQEEAHFPWPRLLKATSFSDLKAIFYELFLKNPKSQDIIANQATWCLDICEEFEKEDGGYFKNAVDHLVRISTERQKSLENLCILRLYQHPPQTSYALSVNIDPLSKSPLLLAQKVHYMKEAPKSYYEPTFLGGMFGPNMVPIQDLYSDLFLTSPENNAHEKEWRLLIDTNTSKKTSSPPYMLLDPKDIVLYKEGHIFKRSA